MEYITLSNEVKIPQLGYGVYQICKEKTKDCVLQALSLGYRHIDTAQAYDNEEEVGQALLESGLKREEIFLTTKVGYVKGYEDASKSIEESLKKLKTDYVDLLLFHWPQGDCSEIYRAIEDAYRSKKARAIGISNFYGKKLDRLLENCTIKPMVNQLETHVFHNQEKSRERGREEGFYVEAWSPLAGGTHNIFKNPILVELANKYHVSPSAIALRYLCQLDIIVIPKTTHIERMKENFDLFSFSLTQEEMKRVKTLDKEKSAFDLFSWIGYVLRSRKSNKER